MPTSPLSHTTVCLYIVIGWSILSNHSTRYLPILIVQLYRSLTHDIASTLHPCTLSSIQHLSLPKSYIRPLPPNHHITGFLSCGSHPSHNVGSVCTHRPHELLPANQNEWVSGKGNNECKDKLPDRHRRKRMQRRKSAHKHATDAATNLKIILHRCKRFLKRRHDRSPSPPARNKRGNHGAHVLVWC